MSRRVLSLWKGRRSQFAWRVNWLELLTSRLGGWNLERGWRRGWVWGARVETPSSPRLAQGRIAAVKNRSRSPFDFDRPPRRTIFAQGRLSAPLKDAPLRMTTENRGSCCPRSPNARDRGHPALSARKHLSGAKAPGRFFLRSLRQSGMNPRPTSRALIQDKRQKQVPIRLRSSAAADDLRSGRAFDLRRPPRRTPVAQEDSQDGHPRARRFWLRKCPAV